MDARDFVKDIDITTITNSIKKYSWKSPVDIPLNIDYTVKSDNSILSFIAPYVNDNKLNTTLSFELTTTYKDGEKGNSPYNVNVIVKRVQRAYNLSR